MNLIFTEVSVRIFTLQLLAKSILTLLFCFTLSPAFIFTHLCTLQQEFFVAGTPVIAYRTGGLRDTVHEWKSEQGEGNGFTFEYYSHEDFVWAVKRALRVFSQPDEYEELRASAYETTIDVSQVAWAWSSEFHRLRNAMYTREDIVANLIATTIDEECDLYDSFAKQVLIEWDGGGDSVILKGSFDNWTADWPLSRGVGQNGAFGLSLLLRPGEYSYKFMVDHEWTVDERLPQRADKSGFNNNVLIVK